MELVVMICNFCGKVCEKPEKWINHDLQEEYNICENCIKKIKEGKFKE